jgi:hypothetical protein
MGRGFGYVPGSQVLVTPDRFHPPSGHGPLLVRGGEDEELLSVAKDVTIQGLRRRPRYSTGCSRRGCAPMASINGWRTPTASRSLRRWGSSRAMPWVSSTWPPLPSTGAKGTGVG